MNTNDISKERLISELNGCYITKGIYTELQEFSSYLHRDILRDIQVSNLKLHT